MKRKQEYNAFGNALGAARAWPRAGAVRRVEEGRKMSERRQSARRRTYLGGRASYEKPVSSDECLVRDRSPGGARIEFPGSTPFPNAFDLTIRDGGETRSVRVVWRDGLQVGVAYESAALPFAPEAARRIRKLEADRNALARRLAQSIR
jgi:hypothetical protein